MVEIIWLLIGLNRWAFSELPIILLERILFKNLAVILSVAIWYPLQLRIFTILFLISLEDGLVLTMMQI